MDIQVNSKPAERTKALMTFRDSTPLQLTVLNIVKSYAGAALLRKLSLQIASGEIACLLGPSGSGKTTLLRIIAGLENAEEGEIVFDGRSMRDVPTHLRGVGLMFQDLALFPHRNVYENIAFGLEMQKETRERIRARVVEMLRLVGLETFAQRDVNQLSGGEQQRVALARALAPNPRLLMLDEPLGALDRVLREQLVTDLRGILKKVGITSLYVTHDQDEAFAIADRVLFIYEGSIAQAGTPKEVYERPANSFVARFLGMDNLLSGRVTQREGEIVRVEAGNLIFQVHDSYRTIGQSVTLLLRPDAAEDINIDGSIPAFNSLRGRVAESRYQVGRPRITLTTGEGKQWTFEYDSPLSVGETVGIKLDASRILVLDS